MSDTSGGPGWWLASDGRWYPPEQHPHYGVQPQSPPFPAPTDSPFGTSPGSPYGTPPGSAYGTPPGSPYRYPTGPDYPYAGPGYYGGPGPTVARTSGMAIASFVCSLGGFILAGIPSVVGVILGFVARGRIRSSHGTQSGAGLALAGIIIGLAEIALIAVLIVGVVLVAQSDARRLQIAGAPGYSTFAGPTGQPLVVGKPWGVACEPIVLQPTAEVPTDIDRQLQQVVTDARAGGVDVTLGTRQNRWYPDTLYPPGLTNREVQFVTIFSTTAPAPLHGFDQRDHIVFSWNAKPAADGTHEILTSLQAEMYLQELTDPTVDQLAVRQLIAFSQGVADSSVPASGIVDGSNIDGYTSRDYAAMRVMSGCHPPAP